ncbi:MAG TPA: aminoglycoside phosphotransferase family protein [Candidatus Dormibacteraeota bacterium]
MGTGYTSVVYDAGADAVLKINFAFREDSTYEADALRLFAGDGAVRLLRDDGRGALLLERLDPGRSLWSLPEVAANEVAASILRRVWRAPPPDSRYPTLEAAAHRWRRRLPGEIADLIPGLLEDPTAPVVLHQDFHHGNALAGVREPWLMIDPKPMVGDPAYDLAPLVRDRRAELAADPDPARRLRRRLDQLCELTEIDRRRARDWAIVQTAAWGPGAPGDYTDQVLRLLLEIRI